MWLTRQFCIKVEKRPLSNRLIDHAGRRGMLTIRAADRRAVEASVRASLPSGSLPNKVLCRYIFGTRSRRLSRCPARHIVTFLQWQCRRTRPCADSVSTPEIVTLVYVCLLRALQQGLAIIFASHRHVLDTHATLRGAAEQQNNESGSRKKLEVVMTNRHNAKRSEARNRFKQTHRQGIANKISMQIEC